MSFAVSYGFQTSFLVTLQAVLVESLSHWWLVNIIRTNITPFYSCVLAGASFVCKIAVFCMVKPYLTRSHYFIYNKYLHVDILVSYNKTTLGLFIDYICTFILFAIETYLFSIIQQPTIMSLSEAATEHNTFFFFLYNLFHTKQIIVLFWGRERLGTFCFK